MHGAKLAGDSIRADEPVAVPDQPINIEMIFDQIIPSSVYPVPNVAFTDGTPLGVSEHLDCLEGE